MTLAITLGVVLSFSRRAGSGGARARASWSSAWSECGTCSSAWSCWASSSWRFRSTSIGPPRPGSQAGSVGRTTTAVRHLAPQPRDGDVSGGAGDRRPPGPRGRSGDVPGVLRGVRPGRWASSSATMRAGRAHNLYLGVGAELGIPGLIVFLIIAWLTMRMIPGRATRQPYTPPRLERLSTPYLLALLTYYVTGLFLHLLRPFTGWMLAVAGRVRPSRSSETACGQRPPIRRHQPSRV